MPTFLKILLAQLDPGILKEKVKPDGWEDCEEEKKIQIFNVPEIRGVLKLVSLQVVHISEQSLVHFFARPSRFAGIENNLLGPRHAAGDDRRFFLLLAPKSLLASETKANSWLGRARIRFGEKSLHSLKKTRKEGGNLEFLEIACKLKWILGQVTSFTYVVD